MGLGTTGVMGATVLGLKLLSGGGVYAIGSIGGANDAVKDSPGRPSPMKAVRSALEGAPPLLKMSLLMEVSPKNPSS